MTDRQGIDGGGAVPSHGSSDQQNPKPLVPGEVFDVGQLKMRWNVEEASKSRGKFVGKLKLELSMTLSNVDFRMGVTCDRV